METLWQFQISWSSLDNFRIIWQDCHNRAWECVSNFITENLTQFVGKSVEAESTVMPASLAWLRDQAKELGNSPEDHGIILFLNCPAIGVISAARHSFILNYISNVLADFPLNSVCFVVHPNRAQQEGRRCMRGWNKVYFLVPGSFSYLASFQKGFTGLPESTGSRQVLQVLTILLATTLQFPPCFR